MDALTSSDFIGRVLAKPLLHPVTYQILIAPGVPLSVGLMKRIHAFGLTEELVDCLIESEALASEPTEPATSGNEAALADEIAEDFELVQDVLTGDFHSFTEDHHLTVMSVIDGIIDKLSRIQGRLPWMRIYGDIYDAHPVNVLMYAIHLANHLGMPRHELTRLAVAAIFHDLELSQRDTPFDYRSITLGLGNRRDLKDHVARNQGLILYLRDRYAILTDDIVQAVLAHHEQWDGQGLPLGLVGSGIPRYARILAVADMYDLLLIHSTENDSLSAKAYHQILDHAGTVFDPEVVEAFSRAFAPFPVNSILQLDSGQVGKVIKQSMNLYRPIVQLGFDSQELDLSRAPSLRIVKQVYPKQHTRHSIRIPMFVARNDRIRYTGYTANMSLTGACLITADVYTPRETYSFQMDLNQRNMHLSIEGKVIWSRIDPSGHKRVDLRFLTTDADTQSVLERFISERMSPEEG